MDDSMIKDEEFKYNIKRIIRGQQILEQKCSPDKSNIYVIVNRHIGDAMRIIRGLHNIKKYYGESASRYHFEDIPDKRNSFEKRKVIKKIILITTPVITGLAKLYPNDWDEIITLPKADVDCVEFYAISTPGKFKNIICDENAKNHFGNNFDETVWVKYILHNCSYMAYETAVPRHYFNDRSSMQINDKLNEEVDNYIKEIELNIEKSVILCPAAQSSGILTNELWEDLVLHINQQGYKVYTNVHGEEKPIKGTEGLDVSLDKIITMAKKGVRIIGVQSGLLDVISEIKPENLIFINVVKTAMDNQFAMVKGVLNEVSKKDGITFIRLEHFEKEYVLNLILNNFK